MVYSSDAAVVVVVASSFPVRILAFPAFLAFPVVVVVVVAAWDKALEEHAEVEILD